MHPIQFEWTLWTLFSWLHLSAVSLLLVNGWCLLDKNYILHHNNQSYRCEDWNMKARDLSYPPCHLVDRDQSTLSLCNYDFDVIQNLYLHNNRNWTVCLTMMSMVVPVQFLSVQRSLVDLVSKKCMDIEVILIPCNEFMKHWFNDVKRHFMSCLIPVHCTYNILITSKTRIQLGLVRTAKVDVIKIRCIFSWSIMKQPIPDEFCCIAVFCSRHHNWFHNVIIWCHWWWQYCILKSTKGWHKALFFIIRFFPHILPTTSANNTKIDAIHWWALVKSNLYPPSDQKCNFQQGWFLYDRFE